MCQTAPTTSAISRRAGDQASRVQFSGASLVSSDRVSPALPAPEGTIEDCHDAGITPETIIPPWYGERLDLDHAIYICLANAANQQGRPDQPDQPDEPEPFRPSKWVIEPADWIAWIRRYYDEHAAA
jgi:hypothetical protein